MQPSAVLMALPAAPKSVTESSKSGIYLKNHNVSKVEINVEFFFYLTTCLGVCKIHILMCLFTIRSIKQLGLESDLIKILVF